MIRFVMAFALLIAGSVGQMAFAQGTLGTAFNYQGELRSGGNPATGNHDFEFRLFDAATGGAQVGPLVALNSVLVQDGLFSVTLDFGDQFTGARRFLAISVRPTGQPAFTALAPRQELLPAPYAQHADFVSDDSVVGANIVDGSVGTADLANASITTPRIANGAVTAEKLAAGVIGELSLADGSVTTPKLAAQAVTTPKIAAGAVTAAKIADGAVGLAQINTNQVQARIGGACPSGLSLLGVDATGAAVCDRALLRLTETAVGPSGSFIGVALRASGRPFIAHLDASNELRVMSCFDNTCSDYVASNTGLVAAVQPLAVGIRSNGRPFIAFTGVNGFLSVYSCANDQCTSGTFRSYTRDAASVAVTIRADDRPLIANYDDSTGDLVLQDCGDTDCSVAGVRVLSSAGVTGASPSILRRSDGRPLIAYRNVTDGDLYVYDCANANCTAGTERLVAFQGSVGARSSIAQTASGEIMISHHALLTGDLMFTHCADPNCDGSNPTNIQTQTLVSTDDVGGHSQVLVRDDGLALILYWNETAGDLNAYECTNNRCQFGTDRQVDGFLGQDVGQYVAGAMRDGLPVAVYLDAATRRLKVLACGNDVCRNP